MTAVPVVVYIPPLDTPYIETKESIHFIEKDVYSFTKKGVTAESILTFVKSKSGHTVRFSIKLTPKLTHRF